MISIDNVVYPFVTTSDLFGIQHNLTPTSSSTRTSYVKRKNHIRTFTISGVLRDDDENWDTIKTLFKRPTIVLMDGIQIGDGTPVLTRIRTGSHSYRIIMSGYQDYVVNNSTINASSIITATMVKQENCGNLAVSSSISGAYIYLDGLVTGCVTPYTFEDISAGNHNVELMLFNGTTYLSYQTNLTSVTVIKNETVTVTPTLFATGDNMGIAIYSDQDNSKVYFDNAFIGYASDIPLNYRGSKSKSHTIIVKKDGYADYSTSITIGGTSQSIYATLTPVSDYISFTIRSRPSGYSKKKIEDYVASLNESTNKMTIIKCENSVFNAIVDNVAVTKPIDDIVKFTVSGRIIW